MSSKMEKEFQDVVQQLSELRQLNEVLITSIQKKDQTIRSNHDEQERIMHKLSEKEIEMLELREANSSVEELKRTIKNQDKKIKKLEQAEAEGEKSKMLQQELKAANDAIHLLHIEFDQCNKK
jgi:predicted RNase H-like nuclease (RuvC/YqgF family)